MELVSECWTTQNTPYEWHEKPSLVDRKICYCDSVWNVEFALQQKLTKDILDINPDAHFCKR